MKILSLAVFLGILFVDAGDVFACDTRAVARYQKRVQSYQSKCISGQQAVQVLAEQAQALQGQIAASSGRTQRSLKSKLKKVLSKLKRTQRSTNSSCSSFAKYSARLQAVAASCAPDLNTDISDVPPGTTPPTENPPVDNNPPSDEQPEDNSVNDVVSGLEASGYTVSLHGDTSSLKTTTIEVVAGEQRFLIYPNGIIWNPKEDIFFLRDYFDNNKFISAKFSSTLARDFVVGSIKSNVPAAITIRNGSSFIIFKLPEQPTLGFGVLGTADGKVYIVQPNSFESVILWMYPELHLLNILKFQIISNMLTAQYGAALGIINNFPGSNTVVDYTY